MDSNYWNDRYLNQNFPWDLGKPSRPLTEYLSTFSDKDIRILIPGGGNGYDAAWAWEQGYKNVVLLDWAPKVIEEFKTANPAFPSQNLVCRDFFQHEGSYDLILEQTFFCALDPSLRMDYVRKMQSLLGAGGKLAGVFFDFPLIEKGPPFGGQYHDYIKYFEGSFEIDTLERCHNSEPDRQGKELFFVFNR